MEGYYCQGNCWISVCAKSAMAGPIFWNVKEEDFDKHLEGLHAEVLRLPEDERIDIVSRLHDLEPEKFVESGDGLEVDLLHLTRNTLWVVDRRLEVFRRTHPLSSVQPSEVASTSTSPPVVPPPRAPLTIVIRRPQDSLQYSCHFKEERQESGDVSQRGHQGQATVPMKRKLGAAGSSKENVPAKKPRISMTDARLKRMASRKTAKVACPKKDDDKRFKEALLKARLQLEKRQEKAKRTGGDGDL